MALVSKITRWMGYLAALPLGIFGFFLFVGAGPDGPHHSVAAHFVGVFLVIFAVTSFIPHRKLLKDKRHKWGASVILAVPLASVLGFFVLGVISDAPVFLEGGSLVSLAVYIALLSPAPISFVLEWAANQYLHPTPGTLPSSSMHQQPGAGEE